MAPESTNHSFDLFRISRAKEVVDFSPTTIRKHTRNKSVPGFPGGLPIYRDGDAVLVSKAELAAFIRAKSAQQSKS